MEKVKKKDSEKKSVVKGKEKPADKKQFSKKNQIVEKKDSAKENKSVKEKQIVKGKEPVSKFVDEKDIAKYNVEEEEEDLGPKKKFVVFELNKEEYGIVVTSAREVIKVVDITPVPNSPDYVSGVINLRGEIILILDLEKKLNMKADSKEGKGKIIVFDAGEKPVGILADAVIGVMDIPEKNIKDPPEPIVNKVGLKYLQGVGIMGKRLIILLDLQNMFANNELEEIQQIKNNF